LNVHYYTAALLINGGHILNGNLRIIGTTQFTVAGNEYQYHRRTTGIETVSTPGPLTQPLTLQVTITHVIATLSLKIYLENTL